MKSPIDTVRAQLKVKRTPEQMAALYEKVNKRCRELGLHKLTDEQLKGQGCPYSGGYPVPSL